MALCGECGGPLVAGQPVASTTAAQVPGLVAPLPDAGIPAAALKAIIFTLLGGLFVIVSQLTYLPLIETGVLADFLGYGGSSGSALNLPPVQLTWGAMSLTPWLTAFAVVEVVALLVPPWRALRLRPAGRRSLNKASVALGLVIAAVQAWMVTSWLLSISASGQPLIQNTNHALFIGAALIAGAFATLLAASFMEERGLLNGFSAVIFVSSLLPVFDGAVGMGHLVSQGHTTPIAGLMSAISVAGAIGLGWFGTGSAPAGELIPRPAAGLLPLSIAASVLMLPVTLAAFVEMPWMLMPGTYLYTGLNGGLVIVLTVVITRLLYTPSRVGAHLEEMEPTHRGIHDDRLARFQALQFSLLAVGVASLAHHGGIGVSAALFILLAAIARDGWENYALLRRRPDVVTAWSLHRLHLVVPAVELLAHSGIEAWPAGLHHRSLGQIFAPFVPVELKVAEPDVERARTLLEAALPRA